MLNHLLTQKLKLIEKRKFNILSLAFPFTYGFGICRTPNKVKSISIGEEITFQGLEHMIS